MPSATPVRSSRGGRPERRRHALQPMPTRKASPAHSSRNEKTRYVGPTRNGDDAVVDEDETGPDEQTDEAVEEEGVRPARPAVLEEAPVREHVAEHAPRRGAQTKARRGADGAAAEHRRARSARARRR